MKPTASDVHVNKPLTNLAHGYAQDKANYIAAAAFPLVPVQKQGDRYFQFDKGDLLRDEAQVRAPGTESAGSGVAIDNTPNYFCDKYAYHEDIDDDRRANADTPLVPDQEATEQVTQKLLTKREIEWASAYFGTSKWDTDLTGVDASPGANQFLQWDDASSNPAADIAVGAEAIRSATGYSPNTLVLGASVYAQLKNNSSVLERIKYTQKGVVTAELLAALFDVERVLVAKAVYNTAAEGQTASMADIFGKAALLLYAAKSPGIRTPSAGYTFAWTGLLGAGAMGMRIKKFRMEHLESDRVEGEMAFDQKLVAADLGCFFTTAIA
jgi:hypothetical protein